MPRQSKKGDKLRAWIESAKPAEIGEHEWQALSAELAPISESYLRKLLRETSAPLAPLVEGVRQDSFEHLERTLLALEGEYESAAASRDAGRMARCRRLVITAKDHARWAARRSTSDPKKGPEKEEMVQWMVVWLENPGVFEQWVRLRRKARQAPVDRSERPANSEG